MLRVAAGTVVGATSLRAQSLPQLRDGFTVSAGIGAGVASVECAAYASGAPSRVTCASVVHCIAI